MALFTLRSKFAVIVTVLSLAGTGMFVDACLKSARAFTLCALSAGLLGCAAENKPSGTPNCGHDVMKPRFL